MHADPLGNLGPGPSGPTDGLLSQHISLWSSRDRAAATVGKMSGCRGAATQVGCTKRFFQPVPAPGMRTLLIHSWTASDQGHALPKTPLFLLGRGSVLMLNGLFGVCVWGGGTAELQEKKIKLVLKPNPNPNITALPLILPSTYFTP